MKRVLAATAVGIAAIAVYATVAPASQQAVTPKQFSALSKKVTKLQKDLKSLTSVVADCLLVEAVPIAQYGNPAGNEGYVYSNPDNTLELQTALDVSPPSAARAWVLITTPDCASLLNNNKKKKLARFAEHTK